MLLDAKTKPNNVLIVMMFWIFYIVSVYHLYMHFTVLYSLSIV